MLRYHFCTGSAIFDVSGGPRVFDLFIGIWDTIVQVSGGPRVLDKLVGVCIRRRLVSMPRVCPRKLG